MEAIALFICVFGSYDNTPDFVFLLIFLVWSLFLNHPEWYIDIQTSNAHRLFTTMPRRTLIEFSATDIQFLNSYLDKWNNIPSTGKGGYSKKHAQMFLDTTTREFWIQRRGGKQYKPKVTLLVHKVHA